MAGITEGRLDDDVHASAGRAQLDVRVERADDSLGGRVKPTSIIDAVVEVDARERIVLREDEADAVHEPSIECADRGLERRPARRIVDRRSRVPIAATRDLHRAAAATLLSPADPLLPPP